MNFQRRKPSRSFDKDFSGQHWESFNPMRDLFLPCRLNPLEHYLPGNPDSLNDFFSFFRSEFVHDFLPFFTSLFIKAWWILIPRHRLKIGSFRRSSRGGFSGVRSQLFSKASSQKQKKHLKRPHFPSGFRKTPE
jgi:hypothetical protein